MNDRHAEQAEETQESGPDVFEAYARLRLAVTGAPESDNPAVGLVTVDADDLRTVLDVPLAHALTDAAVLRGLQAANTVVGMRRFGWGPSQREAIRAAVVAALGGAR